MSGELKIDDDLAQEVGYADGAALAARLQGLPTKNLETTLDGMKKTENVDKWHSAALLEIVRLLGSEKV